MGSLHDRIVSYFVGTFYVEQHLKNVGTVTEAKGILVWGTVENWKEKAFLLRFLRSYEGFIKKKKKEKSTIHVDVPVKVLLPSRASRL